ALRLHHVRRPPCSPPLPYTPLFRSPAACGPPPRPATGGSGAAATTSPTCSCAPVPNADGGTPCSSPPSARAAPDRSPTCSPNRRSEEHTSELQSRENLVCRLLLEKK